VLVLGMSVPISEVGSFGMGMREKFPFVPSMWSQEVWIVLVSAKGTALGIN
jgi:hypothetical protein